MEIEQLFDKIQLRKPKTLTPHIIHDLESNIKFVGVYYTLPQFNSFMSINSGKIVNQFADDKFNYLNGTLDDIDKLIVRVELMKLRTKTLDDYREKSITYSYAINKPIKHAMDWFNDFKRLLQLVKDVKDLNLLDDYLTRIDIIIELYNVVFLTYIKQGDEYVINLMSSNTLSTWVDRFDVIEINTYNNTRFTEPFLLTLEHKNIPLIKSLIDNDMLMIGDTVSKMHDVNSYQVLNHAEDNLMPLMDIDFRFELSNKIMVQGVSKFSNLSIKIDTIITDDYGLEHVCNIIYDMNLMEYSSLISIDNFDYELTNEEYNNLDIFVDTLVYQYFDASNLFPDDDLTIDEMVNNHYIERMKWYEFSSNYPSKNDNKQFVNPFTESGIYTALIKGKNIILYVDLVENKHKYFGIVFGNNVICDVTKHELTHISKINNIESRPTFNNISDYMNCNKVIGQLMSEFDIKSSH